jgi:ABC-type transport system involved in multi-copper enzyme maturation permease subunit
MNQTLRAELRKLLSVRSTYIITGFAILFVVFISFWAQGYKFGAQPGVHFFADNLLQTIAPMTSVAAVLVAILLMAHEYRYNTVIYTLTASNSRSKVLIAKIMITLGYVFALLAVTTALSLVMSAWGLHWAHIILPGQQIGLDVFAKILFYCEAFALAGLLFAVLIRNLVFAIVFMLIVPNTVEGLITLVLKQKAIYLPFSALSQVIATSVKAADNGPRFRVGHLTPLKGALVFCIYLIVGWIVTWYLFLRRDVNN